MQKDDIIRAWKDSEFRTGLTAEEQALLPENPAGLVQLTDEVLEDVVGGGSCICWSCSGGGDIGGPTVTPRPVVVVAAAA